MLCHWATSFTLKWRQETSRLSPVQFLVKLSTGPCTKKRGQPNQILNCWQPYLPLGHLHNVNFRLEDSHSWMKKFQEFSSSKFVVSCKICMVLCFPRAYNKILTPHSLILNFTVYSFLTQLFIFMHYSLYNVKTSVNWLNMPKNSWSKAKFH